MRYIKKGKSLIPLLITGFLFFLIFCSVRSAPKKEEYVLVPGNGSDIPDLYFCSHEATQGDYETYCSYNGSSSQRPLDVLGLGSEYPVYCVNWFDALVYCNKKSLNEGLRPCYSIGGSTNPDDWQTVAQYDNDSSPESWNAATVDLKASGYRLPTGEEWEWAARGGPARENYNYSGSNKVDDVAWYDGNSGLKVHPVMGKAPNSLGLYDMCGNVGEWCWDLAASSLTERIIRGGAYDSDGAEVILFSFSTGFPSFRYYGQGFRVVRAAN